MGRVKSVLVKRGRFFGIHPWFWLKGICSFAFFFFVCVFVFVLRGIWDLGLGWMDECIPYYTQDRKRRIAYHGELATQGKRICQSTNGYISD